LVKKFRALYGTRVFVTVSVIAHSLALYVAS